MVDPGEYVPAEHGHGAVGKAPGTNGQVSPPLKSVWLEAFADPVAGVSAYTPCVHTCNLFGDGDDRLVIADEDRKLKVWKGTQKASEHQLLDTPVAICSFISDNSQPRLPALAVAAGSHIYIYRNLRPYYKFVLPPENVNTEEQDIWWGETGDGMKPAVVQHPVALYRTHDAGVVLQTRSLQLMNIGDPDAKMAFVEHWQGQPLVATTVITCMDVIKQAIDEPDAVSCMVVGTESGRVLIINAAGTAIVKNIWVGITPAMIAVQGELDVGYRITVAGRDGKLYHIRNGELTQTIIQLEAQPVGLVRLSKHVAVGCMNDVIHAYQPNGHKSWSIYLPCHILAMQRMEVTSQRMTKALVVALSNGEVRVYNEKLLVSIHTVPNPVTAMWFGRYGREDNTLITITKSGMLDIKILPRTANLEVGAVGGGPPPEQEIPLAVPKKTRLYVEQTQREREQAADMHRTFQRDLAKLRLTTARAYVKVLTDGQGAAAFTTSTNLSLSLAVAGLGPRFRLSLLLRNESSKQMLDVPVVLRADPVLYSLGKTQFVIPLLVPGLQYTYEIPVTALDPLQGSDNVVVLLLAPGGSSSSAPLLQATIKMPVSEPEDV
ncbi:Bardet-Biedl syndrome protein 1 [Volvox carteri f. nagariensis]|uniref:Bardet-Biedl syndrome protein 1 n=1 Tax=Volvox carteri f. nagariensis TaxID=3068 RepID=D8UGH5_VOLCA|nr:Bardet-Biedl syndrome protein 1 [Volvox carteri f. nagariensis]EFJ41176.1 Bardet-Biedl syndrome protein 1 [Volvox carteri f. nagariensis]|eukprot:XP_002957744.1 Bardet-Biedl syndrome protein 1 [Volvox carteri f. nagariensis]